MSKNQKTIISAITIVAILSIILVITYTPNKQVKENITSTTVIYKTQPITKPETTKEVAIETNIEVTTLEEQKTTIKEKAEENKDTVTTTKSSNSNNSSNKTEVKETTTKKTTTTKPTTEKVTSSPKDKFPEGYIVTSNPHGNPSTEGDYWTSCSEEYVWKFYPEEEEVCDEDGNILKGDWWLNNHVNGYCPSEKKYILYEAMGKYYPKHEGSHEGEVYKYTIGVWIPD